MSPQPERELSPWASPSAFLGWEIRSRRKSQRLSVALLGSQVHVSGALIAKIEKAERRPHPQLLANLDRVLSAEGALLRLGAYVEHQERLLRVGADRLEREGDLAVAVERLCGVLSTEPGSVARFQAALRGLAIAYSRLVRLTASREGAALAKHASALKP